MQLAVALNLMADVDISQYGYILCCNVALLIHKTKTLLGVQSFKATQPKVKRALTERWNIKTKSSDLLQKQLPA